MTGRCRFCHPFAVLCKNSSFLKKVIALLLTVMMIAALCACGSTTETTETTEAATPEPVAAETATEAPAEAAAPAAAGDLEAYKAYVSAYAEAGAPTDDEKAAAVAAIAACTTAAEVEECQHLTPMFSGEMILTYDAWVEAAALPPTPATWPRATPTRALPPASPARSPLPKYLRKSNNKSAANAALLLRLPENTLAR